MTNSCTLHQTHEAIGHTGTYESLVYRYEGSEISVGFPEQWIQRFSGLSLTGAATRRPRVDLEVIGTCPTISGSSSSS